MLRNHLRLIYRSLFNNKRFFLINLTGLSISLCCCLLVATVVIDELSYDKFWKNKDNIYRITSTSTERGMIKRSNLSIVPLGPELKKNFPEVKDFCRMDVGERSFIMKKGMDPITFQAILTNDTTLWNVLDFPIVQGTPQKFIKGYVNLVISQKIKDEYFPDTDPVGQVIWNSIGTANTIITGVIKTLPSNTHLRADVIALDTSPFSTDNLAGLEGYSATNQYLLLAPHTNVKNTVNKINQWYEDKRKELYHYKKAFDLQPFTDIYLRSDFNEPPELRGSISRIYAFAAASIFILLIACVNYVNLSTAHALKRIRTTGIQKILGAEKKYLIQQFLLEALVFFILSYLLANLFYWLALPPLEKYLEHALSVHLFQHLGMQAAALTILLTICLLTGFYPAYLFSGYQIVNSIKGNLTEGLSGELFRKGLITFQFVITLMVIVATIVVYAQYHFLNNKDLGYNKENLLVIKDAHWGETGQLFKNELLNRHGVEMATIANWGSAGPIVRFNSSDPQDRDNLNPVYVVEADMDFTATLGLKLKAGRLFNPQLISDQKLDPTHPKVLASEDLSNLVDFELNKPIMKKINVQVVPIGILNNFHVLSLLKRTEPFVILNYPHVQLGNMYIRIKPGTGKQVIVALQELWPKFYPSRSLRYSYMSDILEKQYRQENKLNKQLGFFTLIIVFITCLGLYGLVGITVEKRTKEIGIRKIMGAQVRSILSLIAKDFLKLVVLALVVASPLVWYLLNKWLMNYPYRIDIQFWMFALAGLVCVLIAFLTISLQTIKVATANPIKALRDD